MARRRRVHPARRALSLPFWLALAGIVGGVVLLPRQSRRCRSGCRRAAGPLYTLLDNKYYFDRFNDWFFAGGARALGRFLSKVGDRTIIDGFFVNGAARVVGWAAALLRPRAVGLRLPLRVHDDHRRLRAADLVGRGESGADAVPLARHLGPDRRRPRRARGRPRPRRRRGALDRADRRARRLPGHAAALAALRRAAPSNMQFVERARVDPALRHPLLPRRRRHLDAVRAAEQPDDARSSSGRPGR